MQKTTSRSCFFILFVLHLFTAQTAAAAIPDSLQLTAAGTDAGAQRTPRSAATDASRILKELTVGLQQSPWFIHVGPADFIDNLERRIADPDAMTQGKGTNFCGPVLLASQLFITYDPVGYVTFMVSLYKDGTASYYNGTSSVCIKPSPEIRDASGWLPNGRNGSVEGSEALSDNPADQMLLLVIKEKYNTIGGKFRMGRQDRYWAGSTFKNVVYIAEHFLGYTYEATGSTFGGSDWNSNGTNAYIKLIKDGIASGKVAVLFLNGPIWRNQRHIAFKNLTGTHFVRIHDITVSGDYVTIDMWDYGKRRIMKMPLYCLNYGLYGTILFNKP